MNKLLYVLLILSIVLNVYLIISCNNEQVINNYTGIMDSLNMKEKIICNKKESTLIKIDTIIIKIREYEEEAARLRSDIIDNDIGDDYEFFSEYVGQYSDITSAVEDSESDIH